LDYVLKNPQFKSQIDRRRIAAAGHSAGGTTVLLLAGARLSKTSFQNPIPYCKEMPADLDDEHCSELKRYDYSKINRQDLGKSYYDQRIKVVVAIDPGFERSLHAEPAPKTPVLFILADRLKDPSGEIFAKEFIKKFPNMKFTVVPNSIHISFISECSQFGYSIRAPICEGDAHREQIHLVSNEDIEQFLKLNLP
jgi:predicted dienelactone hydrolase